LFVPLADDPRIAELFDRGLVAFFLTSSFIVGFFLFQHDLLTRIFVCLLTDQTRSRAYSV
jgi:hypothetical protein